MTLSTVFIARFDSSSFEFVAVDTTREKAVDAMVKGLQAHTKKMGLEADWWGDADDLNVDECPIGGCLRDRTLLTGPEQAPSNVVKDGSYHGLVLSVVDGVVTQKIDRAGDTVRHDASKLSMPLKAGDVADIQYSNGQGLVSGVGKGAGVGR